MKVLWLFNHPAPYKVRFFNLLGEKVDLTAVFERRDEGGRNKNFYDEEAKTFRPVFLNGLALGEGNSLCRGFKKIIKEGYDIVVINGWSTLTEMNAIRYLKKRKIPYIFAINGGIAKLNEASWKKRLKTRAISEASLYLSPDENGGRYLTHYGADPKRIRFYPYSTIYENELRSKPLAKEERASFLKELGIPDGHIYTAIGSFIERKNGAFLLREIWPHVSEDKTLYLVGGGPQEALYREIIREKRLSNVHLIPFQDKQTVLKWLSISDLSIFLTNEDIYGHVANESLSQRTPVLGSVHSNAVKHLIKKDGENGYLVEPHDKKGILKALERGVTEDMREHAFETAKENTLERMVESHLRSFEEYLAK